MSRHSTVVVAVLAAAVALTTAIVVIGRSHTHAQGHAAPVQDILPVQVAASPPTPEERLARGLLDRSTVRKVDDFVTPDGDRFTVSEGRTKDGAKTCVVSAGRGGAGSACDASPFSRSPVLFVESFSAGPGGKDVTNWELSGLAGPQVGRLVLVDSAGHDHSVHLGKGGAFFFAFSRGEVKRSLSAESLEVYDANGRLIDQTSL